jgi:hypothetical protein
MRSSDKFIAIGLAVIVWLVAGYALASRPSALQAITPPALDAGASAQACR